MTANSTDHERIWLAPACCERSDTGRMWSRTSTPVACEHDVPWTEYVRADLAMSPTAAAPAPSVDPLETNRPDMAGSSDHTIPASPGWMNFRTLADVVDAGPVLRLQRALASPLTDAEREIVHRSLSDEARRSRCDSFLRLPNQEACIYPACGRACVDALFAPTVSLSPISETVGAQPLTDETETCAFAAGDPVAKSGAGYSGPGRVVATFPAADSSPRYVVAHRIEGGEGEFYHIYGEKQLAPGRR